MKREDFQKSTHSLCACTIQFYTLLYSNRKHSNHLVTGEGTDDETAREREAEREILKVNKGKYLCKIEIMPLSMMCIIFPHIVPGLSHLQHGPTSSKQCYKLILSQEWQQKDFLAFKIRTITRRCFAQVFICVNQEKE